MALVDYQRELVDYIYKLLTNDDANKGIVLSGCTGSGKSTIAMGVAKQLQENWSVFYIEGIEPSISPYLTWHIGTKLYSKAKLNIDGWISFGISFFPTPVSFELGGSFQRTKQNYILTPSEEAIISDIKKQADMSSNILFIADNYDSWDMPSKQLLQKIMLTQLELLDNLRIAIILVTNEKAPIGSDIEWVSVPVADISDDNILAVLRHKGYSGQVSIQEIRRCAGNDLSLALMAASYYSTDGVPTCSFDEIMDKHYNSLSQDDQEACRILEPLSIIDSYFTKDETAFFLDPAPQDEDYTRYKAEEHLALAEQLLLIAGNENYHFTNEKIKDYFKVRLAKREKYYHKKFSHYLQKSHPEDYYNRGKHLMRSLQSNDSKTICEAWQLLLLAYIRRVSEIRDTEDIYSILRDINCLQEQLNSNLSKKQRHVLNELLAGYKAFSEYHYKDSLFHLQAITPSQLILACSAECQRLILLCHVQLAENPQLIIEIAEELYETINETDFCEDEQYCRAALVLLDVYIDRFTDDKKIRVLKKNLIQIIQCHPDQPVFEEFEACYNRKAALYFTAVIASRQTAQSVQFYRDHHNKNGLYMSLCNHSGNAIVSGAYTIANQALTECAQMLQKSNGWYYPSQYKVKNNQIILDYLCAEDRAANDQVRFLTAARKAATTLYQIAGHQDDEISHVVFLNYLGLSILCERRDWQSELVEANKRLAQTDAYYRYFLHDLNFARDLLQEDYAHARNEMDILTSIDVPLLRDYNQIFIQRRRKQQHLLETQEQLNGSPMKYHRSIVAACSHVQDPSCRFWGRGFLLSDLQFLSF